jgi:fluoride exporter
MSRSSQAGASARPQGSGQQWDVVAVIAAGGAIGGVGRWGLGLALPHGPAGFPWSTFLVNVSGCLVIGALMTYLLEVRLPGRYARAFLAVGVLGGFTTFSGYTSDIRVLLQAGQAPLAIVYLAGTVLLGLLATVAGAAGVRSLQVLARSRPAAPGDGRRG